MTIENKNVIKYNDNDNSYNLNSENYDDYQTDYYDDYYND